MKTLQNTPHDELAGIHDHTLKILEGLSDPTEESIAKAFASIPPSVTKALVPFTGYYTMDIGRGAFLSIDTTEYFYRLSQPITVTWAAITISISMDGKKSITYPVDQNTKFDGQTLTIPNILTITFTRNYQDGTLVKFSGQIYGTNVTGATRFNPITLPTFIGQYTQIPSMQKVLSVGEKGISFDFGQGLSDVKYYTFTPLMFVLMFNAPASTDKYVLMMGTAGSMGLACYIQHGAGGAYAVTIPG